MDQDIIDPGKIYIPLQFFIGAAVWGVGMYVRRQEKRIEQLEEEMKGMVTLKTHNDTLQSLRQEIKDWNEKIFEEQRITNNHVYEVLKMMANKNG